MAVGGGGWLGRLVPTRRAVVRAGAGLAAAAVASPLRAKPAARLAVRPAVALPGMTVLVDARRFSPGAAVRLTWETTGALLATAKANRLGRVLRPVALPAEIAADGEYAIVASAGGRTARVAITVRVPLGPPVAFGAFIEGAPGDPALLDAFAERVGREPAISLWFQHWGLPATQAFDRARLEAVASRGAVPLITWEPWNPAAPDDPRFGLERIAAGAFDDYVDGWAAGLRDWGGRVLLRWGHEMNGAWYPWAAGYRGRANDAAPYVAAWQRLRRRFAAAGADNVEWVWAPNVAYPGSAPLAPLYPGDGLVDWIGLDGYNWGTRTPDRAWQSFAAIFGPTLAELPDLSDGSSAKPVIVTETASAEEGGDKAAWIRDALLNDLPLAFPEIRALIWFDENKERDWRVASSDAAQRAFAEAVAAPYYGGTLAAVAGSRRPGRGGAPTEREPRDDRQHGAADAADPETGRDGKRRRRAKRGRGDGGDGAP